MLIVCQGCGKHVSDSALACPKCGAQADEMLGPLVACRECQVEGRPSHTACLECGAPQSIAFPAAPAAAADDQALSAVLTPTPSASDPAVPTEGQDHPPDDLKPTSFDPAKVPKRLSAAQWVLRVFLFLLIAAPVLGVVQKLRGDIASPPSVTQTAAQPQMQVTAIEVHRAIQQAPNSDMMKAMERSFNRDYWAILEKIAAGASSTSPDAALRGQRQDLTRSFFTANASFLGRAPTAEILDLTKTQIGIAQELLAVSGETCAALLGSSQGLTPERAALPQLDRNGARLIAAFAAGRDNPVNRDPPTEEDLAAYVEAVDRRIANPGHMLAIQNGTLGALEYDTQCRIGIGLLEAYLDIAPEAAARVYASEFP